MLFFRMYKRRGNSCKWVKHKSLWQKNVHLGQIMHSYASGCRCLCSSSKRADVFMRFGSRMKQSHVTAWVRLLLCHNRYMFNPVYWVAHLSRQKHIILQSWSQSSDIEEVRNCRDVLSGVRTGFGQAAGVGQVSGLAFDLVDVPLNLYISTAMQAEWGNKW